MGQYLWCLADEDGEVNLQFQMNFDGAHSIVTLGYKY